jgi:hypothetical protein
MKKFIPLTLIALSATSLVGYGSPLYAASQREEHLLAKTDNTGLTKTPTKTVTPVKALPVKNPAVIIPTGTVFNTDLLQEISTGKDQNDREFTLKIKNGSVGKYPILKDAQIEGHLENVIKAAKGKKAKLTLVFDGIKLKNGDTYPLKATLVNTSVETKTKGKFLQNTGIILGGAIGGHFLGKKTKFKNGALAGGAAATAYVLSSPGGEVVLKKGTDIKLKLTSDLKVD